MILPNKLISLNDSIAYKSTFILDEIKNKLYSPAKLYILLSEKFEDINEYIIALDLLCLMGYVNLDITSGVLEYVEENNM